ncbi:hypothetical protein ILUMI_22014 [Ignelater luminosus]|uniref:CRAL-TRIO domain-containing protein n=1 Tax=Ignelater luminosus TaxID=2038154 RepID=A0A8K0CHW0_IGNLU|nr:hypothetical protein ILUMI_22014 [Ignelater luminosus]
MCTNGIVDFSGKTLSDEDVKKCVKDLLKLVLEHDKLKRFRTEDSYLLRFLHCSEFDVSLALKKMEDFTNLLLEYPDWFGNTSPLHMKSQIEVGDKVIMKERDKKGRGILILKLGKLDVVNSCPAEQARIVEVWMESIMDDPTIQASGLSTILDLNGYSWRLFRWVTPTNTKMVAKRVDTYPLKEILIHVVNTSFLLSATIKFIWPFLNDKLKNMFKFHFDNWPSLHEYISPDVLPAEYGGDGPDINMEKSIQVLFDQDSSIGAKLIYHRISDD